MTGLLVWLTLLALWALHHVLLTELAFGWLPGRGHVPEDLLFGIARAVDTRTEGRSGADGGPSGTGEWAAPGSTGAGPSSKLLFATISLLSGIALIQTLITAAPSAA